MRRLSTSREQRVRQLHSHEEIGDRKPSHFLRHLTQDLPDDFLRTFWASRLLPHVVQAILAGQTEDSLDSASHLADRVCEVAQPTTSSVSLSVPDNTAGLLERVEDLSLQLASLRAPQTPNRSHSIHSHTPLAQRIENCTLSDLVCTRNKNDRSIFCCNKFTDSHSVF